MLLYIMAAVCTGNKLISFYLRQHKPGFRNKLLTGTFSAGTIPGLWLMQMAGIYNSGRGCLFYGKAGTRFAHRLGKCGWHLFQV